MTRRRGNEDVLKLPKWAQRRIAKLEADLRHERERLAIGPAASNTFADPYATPPRALGVGTLIRFHIGDGIGDEREHIDVRVKRNYLDEPAVYIMGSDSVAIQPESSNTATIALVDRTGGKR